MKTLWKEACKIHDKQSKSRADYKRWAEITRELDRIGYYLSNNNGSLELHSWEA